MRIHAQLSAAGRDLALGFVYRGQDNCVQKSMHCVNSGVRTHAEGPFGVLFDRVHLGIPVRFPVFGRVRCVKLKNASL